MKVLMADDEAAIRSLFRHFLDKYPSPYITYEIFSTGDELRQACLKNAPNVVFTDIKMPGTSGLEAIYEIKQATADNATGYYVISGYTDFDYALQSLRLGIKDYLLKPMKYSQIESILRKEEENIFMGITLEDAWKLNNESLARKLSDCVQNLALAYQIRDRSYQKVLQNWAFIASGIPIDKTYFKEKFGTAIEDFSAQKTFFENASASESEEKYSRQIVKKVVEIIENNYQNAALGMDSIADKLGYSTQYLSMAFSKEEFAEKIREIPGAGEVSAETLPGDVQVLKTDGAGYVEEIQIGTKSYRGEEVQYTLGLASPCFSVEEYDGGLRVVTKGIGHGYGLSQYGAHRKAQEGWTAEEILTYFYKNIEMISV